MPTAANSFSNHAVLHQLHNQQPLRRFPVRGHERFPAGRNAAAPDAISSSGSHLPLPSRSKKRRLYPSHPATTRAGKLIIPSQIAKSADGYLYCSNHFNFVFFPQYYRARYETEGIRGPLKGLDNNHPAVQVCSW